MDTNENLVLAFIGERKTVYWTCLCEQFGWSCNYSMRILAKLVNENILQITPDKDGHNLYSLVPNIKISAP